MNSLGWALFVGDVVAEFAGDDAQEANRLTGLLQTMPGYKEAKGQAKRKASDRCLRELLRCELRLLTMKET